jgi:hypothetical protein
MDEIETKSASAVAAILGGAGWKADPGWGGFTHGTCVGGLAPDGNVYVKNWAAIGPDHPKYSADTPDTAEEAAQWLADRYKANPLTTEATLDPVALQSEEVENPGDESNGETGEVSQAVQGNEEPVVDGEVSGIELGVSDELDARSYGDEPGEYTDADFTEGQDLGSELLDVESELLAPELPAPDPEDFAPDEFQPEEDAGSAFIFGDNLGQRRTSAIGLIWQHAAQIMPAWGANDNQRLGELRNFAAGVAAGTFTNSDALQAELDALEISVRRINEIESARDSKIQFVNTATHEQLDAFDPAADWP